MSGNFKKPIPGISYKNGKLYVFKKSSAMVLMGWPTPMAWVKRSRKGWMHDRKHADKFFSKNLFMESGRPPLEPPDPDSIACPNDLNSPMFTDAEREQRWGWHKKRVVREWKEKHRMADFFDTIPPAIRVALSHYATRKWHVFNLLARCPGAYDLHVSNPALCYALASNWVFHQPAVQQPMRAARSLVRKKQKEILGWLGFPATDAVRKILRKIPAPVLSVETLLYLRTTLQDPARVKALGHLPRLNAGALRLATSVRIAPLITFRLLEEVAMNHADDDDPHTHRILLDTLRMDRRLGGNRCPRRFVSLHHLEHWHDDLAGEVNRRMRQLELENPEADGGAPLESVREFPAPPYAGTATIQPILTPAELLHEGTVMKHCVASYAWGVAGGEVYIYRVLEPVRATLSICARGKNWEPGQLLRAANQPVGREIKTQVFRDLLASRRQISIPIKPGDEVFPDDVPAVVPGIPRDHRGTVVTEMSDGMEEAVNRVRAMFAGT